MLLETATTEFFQAPPLSLFFLKLDAAISSFSNTVHATHMHFELTQEEAAFRISN